MQIRSRQTAFIHDLIMIPLAWFGAFWLRFNLEAIPQVHLDQALKVFPILVFIQAVAFWYFGLYRGVWRFASMADAVRITKAVAVGMALSGLAIFLATRLVHIPRSVFPLYGLLLLVFLSGPRFVYRWLKDHKFITHAGQRVLIVGAGQAGEMLVRDLFRDPDNNYHPVGFVDDDPRKQGRDIHGVRVLGACGKIPEIAAGANVDRIMIALPSANAKQMRRIVQYCEESAVPFRTLPGLQDLITGRVSVRELREVSIEDILGREPVSLDWDAINDSLTGKTVMVTGGGGSIGSELCRQIARLGPRRLVILEQSEYNLYSIELELRRIFPNFQVEAVLGDVADGVLVGKTLEAYRPEVIFHAAAYKHVPLLEHQVRTAVRNNIIGTKTVASLAAEHGCNTFVMISTDKAVNPGNIMGTTKRVAEIYCQALNGRNGTKYLTVRFGNVLGSAGSVIPLFREQISRGGPVTVTHPDISRFFMTIPEATQLILQATTMGDGGEIFVLDMGEPIKIAYLAKQMIILSGKQPGEDIEIVYTGLRPGEKLYEELFHSEEKRRKTAHRKIFKAESRMYDYADIEQCIGRLKQACERNLDGEIKRLLGELVPESRKKPADDAAGGGGKPKKAEVVEIKSKG